MAEFSHQRHAGAPTGRDHEPGRLMHAALILRAVPMALQPPRLIVALMVVAALVATGRVWDAITPATVGPGGLLATPLTVNEQAANQERLVRALQRYAPNSELAIDETARLDPGKVLAAVQAGYRAGRPSPEAEPDAEAIAQADAAYLATRDEIAALRPRGTFEAVAASVVGSFRAAIVGITTLDGRRIYTAVGDLFVRTPAAVWSEHRGFGLVYGIVAGIILAIGGGALCRMAACEVAGRERLRITDAFDFGLGNATRLILALLMPLLAAALGAVVLVPAGLLLRVPGLDVLTALLYGLALLVGLFIAFMLICYLAAGWMLIPAVACENCDAPDAQQRAFSYLLHHPLRLAGYVAVAVAGLVLGYLVVALFAATTLNVTGGLLATLAGGHTGLADERAFSVLDLAARGPGEMHEGWTTSSAAWLIDFWQSVVMLLVAAFVVAYLFIASTIIYLLMRRVCDGQGLEEIWQPGMVRGTLTPAPGRERSAPPPPGRADRTMTRLARTASGLRYGRSSSDRGAPEASHPTVEPKPDRHREVSAGNANADTDAGSESGAIEAIDADRSAATSSTPSSDAPEKEKT